MPRSRIRILTDDQYPDIGQRASECPQYVHTSGQVATAGSHLLTQVVAHFVDLGLHTGQRLGPGRVDQLAKRPWRHKARGYRPHIERPGRGSGTIHEWV
jgi:hypothetical protein